MCSFVEGTLPSINYCSGGHKTPFKLSEMRPSIWRYGPCWLSSLAPAVFFNFFLPYLFPFILPPFHFLCQLLLRHALWSGWGPVCISKLHWLAWQGHWWFATRPQSTFCLWPLPLGSEVNRHTLPLMYLIPHPPPDVGSSCPDTDLFLQSLQCLIYVSHFTDFYIFILLLNTL